MAVAAYAAVVSLIHVLDQVQHPSRHRLHLDRDRIETIRKKVSFLQEFLELYSHIRSKEIEDFAVQICDVAVEAEDVIDTHVVDQLRAISVDKSGRALSLFCEDIDRVIEKIDFIKEELMVVKEGMAGQEQHPRVPVPAVSTAPPSISSGKNIMVGFDEHLVRIMDMLTATGFKSNLQILPIVGMGGIGKTTIARNVFEDPCIERHFHIRGWVTISQEYSVDRMLVDLLQDMGVHYGQENEERIEDLAKLGEQLHKSLSGKRYLIVMDDLWSTEAWGDLKLFFPDNGNRSRILVTTRLSNVAVSLSSHKFYLMDFLDEDQSWNLLRVKAFAEKNCPPELEEIGRNIAKSCKGLPLAIVVIGGLLSNSIVEREYWEFVAMHVNLFANSENDEHCLKILSLSYSHLPLHLKPCFLYMRVFSEDDEIQVSKLIKLWVAEGFLKPIVGKSFEEVAKEYLKDLVDRNLILVRKWTHRGNIKTCSIHDLLRDLCLREFQKEHFLRCPKMQNTCFTKYEDACFLCNGPHTCTRIYLSQVIVASRATLPASCCSVCHICRSTYSQLNAVRLVRVIAAVDGPFSTEFSTRLYCKEILHPTKLRYLSLKVHNAFELISTSMPLLWNLQTVSIRSDSRKRRIDLPSEMWEMPQLRHLIIDEAILPNLVVTRGDMRDSTIILENLQTLSTVFNFRCSNEVLERIPNLTKLRIRYHERGNNKWSHYSLHNLAHLHKLESLYLEGVGDYNTLKMVVFPHSLKRLILTWCSILWEEMTIIGSLPNLEVLKLYSSGTGFEWNPVEGEFLKLKLLLLGGSHLPCWAAEKIHFPNLQTLILRNMYSLEEIPAGIGEIETLRLIDLCCCRKSIVDSAKKIQEEQENLGIEGLQLRVTDTLSWRGDEGGPSNITSHPTMSSTTFGINLHSQQQNMTLLPAKIEPFVTQLPAFPRQSLPAASFDYDVNLQASFDHRLIYSSDATSHPAMPSATFGIYLYSQQQELKRLLMSMMKPIETMDMLLEQICQASSYHELTPSGSSDAISHPAMSWATCGSDLYSQHQEIKRLIMSMMETMDMPLQQIGQASSSDLPPQPLATRESPPLSQSNQPPPLQFEWEGFEDNDTG